MLSGKPTPHIPDFIFRYIGEPYWWLAHNILTLSTPIGRKVQLKIRSSGAPLISISLKDIKEAHIEQIPRITDVQNGFPVSEDGRLLSVKSIIWATGYKPDFSWIKFDAVDSSGWPQATRGISQNHKGLYFVGMLFQFGLTSGLVGGVGRDASFVVEHLKKIKKAA